MSAAGPQCGAPTTPRARSATSGSVPGSSTRWRAPGTVTVRCGQRRQVAATALRWHSTGSCSPTMSRVGATTAHTPRPRRSPRGVTCPARTIDESSTRMSPSPSAHAQLGMEGTRACARSTPRAVRATARLPGTRPGHRRAATPPVHCPPSGATDRRARVPPDADRGAASSSSRRLHRKRTSRAVTCRPTRRRRARTGRPRPASRRDG
jgi:hypothetical protein